jgi:hypothetical protein
VVQAATTAREVVREDEGTTDLYDPNIESPEETMGRKSRVDTVRKALTRAGRTDLVPVMEGLLEGQSMTELRVVFGPVTDQLGSVLKALRV